MTWTPGQPLPFKREFVGNWRIVDADDNRIATCYEGAHAQQIVDALNYVFVHAGGCGMSPLRVSDEQVQRAMDAHPCKQHQIAGLTSGAQALAIVTCPKCWRIALAAAAGASPVLADPSSTEKNNA